MNDPLLRVENLKVYFDVPGKGWLARPVPLKAIDSVSFDLGTGETLGIVGESGCGKSTLGRAILQLIEPTAGRVVWQDQDISALSRHAMRPYRRDMQIIFQDPLASLDPRMTIGQIIGEPLRTHNPGLSKADLRAEVRTMMDRVGLLGTMINRYPHEFSGGQCQRIGVARAMILQPKMIVCDEPVSALDVSIQAQIVNLLEDLRRDFNVALLFISHDLSVVRHISDRIMVLYLGNVMELADRDALYARPRHPYTQALISAVPIPDPERERAKQRIVLSGDLPSPTDPPSGCVFRTRCPLADETCAREVPALRDLAPGHRVACHKALD